MKFGLLVGVMAAAMPIAASGVPLTCKWHEKVLCGPGSGCKPIDASKVYATVDLKTKQYRRCDRQGCDGYPGNVSTSGAFTIIDVPGRGMLAKIGPGGRSTEIVTLMNDVMISHGTCR